MAELNRLCEVAMATYMLSVLLQPLKTEQGKSLVMKQDTCTMCLREDKELELCLVGNELPMKMADVGKMGKRSSFTNEQESNLKGVAPNLSFSGAQQIFVG